MFLEGMPGPDLYRGLADQRLCPEPVVNGVCPDFRFYNFTVRAFPAVVGKSGGGELPRAWVVTWYEPGLNATFSYGFPWNVDIPRQRAPFESMVPSPTPCPCTDASDVSITAAVAERMAAMGNDFFPLWLGTPSAPAH
jgi:hypothetical protein